MNYKIFKQNAITQASKINPLVKPKYLKKSLRFYRLGNAWFSCIFTYKGIEHSIDYINQRYELDKNGVGFLSLTSLIEHYLNIKIKPWGKYETKGIKNHY